MRNGSRPRTASLRRTPLAAALLALLALVGSLCPSIEHRAGTERMVPGIRRKLMRRFTTGVVLALLSLLLVPLPATAGLEWCPKDPVVELNGVRVEILVAIPAEYVGLVNGPIDVAIATPRGTERTLVFTDDGFNGYGEVVRFTDLDGAPQTSFPARITVVVPLSRDSAIPVQVTVTPATGGGVVVQGTSSNVTVAVRIADR